MGSQEGTPDFMEADMAALRTVFALLVLVGGLTACGDDDAATTVPPSPADITTESDFMVYRTASKILAGEAADCVEAVIDSHLDPGAAMFDLFADEPDFTTCSVDPISEAQLSLADLGSPWVREFTVRVDTLALTILRLRAATPETAQLFPDGECLTAGVRTLEDDELFRLHNQVSTPPGDAVDAEFLAIAEGCGWVEAGA